VRVNVNWSALIRNIRKSHAHDRCTQYARPRARYYARTLNSWRNFLVAFLTILYSVDSPSVSSLRDHRRVKNCTFCLVRHFTWRGNVRAGEANVGLDFQELKRTRRYRVSIVSCSFDEHDTIQWANELPTKMTRKQNGRIDRRDWISESETANKKMVDRWNSKEFPPQDKIKIKVLFLYAQNLQWHWKASSTCYL